MNNDEIFGVISVYVFCLFVYRIVCFIVLLKIEEIIGINRRSIIKKITNFINYMITPEYKLFDLHDALLREKLKSRWRKYDISKRS